MLPRPNSAHTQKMSPAVQFKVISCGRESPFALHPMPEQNFPRAFQNRFFFFFFKCRSDKRRVFESRSFQSRKIVEDASSFCASLVRVLRSVLSKSCVWFEMSCVQSNWEMGGSLFSALTQSVVVDGVRNTNHNSSTIRSLGRCCLPCHRPMGSQQAGRRWRRAEGRGGISEDFKMAKTIWAVLLGKGRSLVLAYWMSGWFVSLPATRTIPLLLWCSSKTVF